MRGGASYEDILNMSTSERNNIGKLIHACGLGKALLGILIVQKLKF
jgi:hypothetical protein